MNTGIRLPTEEQLGEKVAILLADDHPVFRKAIRDILERQPDFIVVGEAENGEDAIKQTEEKSPDIVIMDIGMSVMNGLEATRCIKSQNPNIAVLVLTVYDDTEHVKSILEAGAEGYLTKRAFASEIVSSIRSILAGETVIKTSVFKEVVVHALRYYQKPIELQDKINLTGREMVVFKLAAKGLNNKEISQRLNLSFSTVKGYMVGILSKFNAKSRTEAVIMGLRTGLLSIRDIE